MTIQIHERAIQRIKKDVLYQMQIETGSREKDERIPSRHLTDIKNLLSTNEIKSFLNNVGDKNYFIKFDYRKLAGIYEASELLFSNIKEIRDAVDVEIFLKDGYNLDIAKLRKMYWNRQVKEQFPNFDFSMLKKLYRNPPKTIPTYYDKSKEIIIDEFVFRKYMIGIIQMVFNHMDLLICAVGSEGAGKSLKISQDMLLMHWLLTKLKIIDYEFDINEIWHNTLKKFLETEDKYFDQPFRIIGLDEGNELNRQDWNNDEVKTFFQRLRRERYNRRIKYISLPVLGELISNIVISRMNFVFNMLTSNETTTGTLYKGVYDFYIIPRGDKIYSHKLKREIEKAEIKSKLHLNLKDREYLKGMPKDICVKRCRCNGVWGFEEKSYNKALKDSNISFKVQKGMTLEFWELFIFYKSAITPKKLGIKFGDPKYYPIHALIRKINLFWERDPDLLMKYEAIFRRKLDAKGLLTEEDEENFKEVNKRTKKIKKKLIEEREKK